MGYTLLTGATGLLGRYLMRDLTLAGLPLAVVVRPAHHEPAEQRIESAMAHWDKQLGRSLLRPVVLQGNLTEPNLGLDAAGTAWLRSHVDTIVHSAASLTFHAEESRGEPWLSNTLGTRNVLDLCRVAGIRNLHHVSTAYVCGDRRGRILENELNVGQQPGNDYERTKLQAEEEVRAAEHIDTLTVHRPSIIVGDSTSGFTSSFHGFYTPLRLVHSLLSTVSRSAMEQSDWLGGLQLKGDERKNLVPVDWVSSAMTSVITNPDAHGQTYHLTNPHATTSGEMLAVMATALIEHAPHVKEAAYDSQPSEEIVASFRQQMEIYQAYWNDDPDFDSSHLQAVIRHMPCPEVDGEVMKRLTDFAIRTNFGWPRAPSPAPAVRVQSYLEPFLVVSVPNVVDRNPTRVNLNISGGGGGQWCLTLQGNRIVAVETGVRSDDVPACFLTSETFSRLLDDQLPFELAVRTGRLLIEGTAGERAAITHVFNDLASRNRNPQLKTTGDRNESF